jgi:hypothetical protein
MGHASARWADRIRIDFVDEPQGAKVAWRANDAVAGVGDLPFEVC